MRMKQAELTARNVAGGYWLAAADPAIVAHAITGDVPRQHVQRQRCSPTAPPGQ